MKLSPEERANIRQSFGRMTLAQKLDYIWTYYKLPILAVGALLFFAVSYGSHLLTQKRALLYAAYMNVAVGEDLDTLLDTGYVSSTGADPRRAEVVLYRNMYLSQDPSAENHEYAYASRMKLMATIQSQKLDVVLMNRESYDILSADGYLLDLSAFVRQEALTPFLTANTVILEDNAIEFNLGEAETYQAVTQEVVNGLDVSAFPCFQNAGFSGEVYLGVIGNSPRLEAVGDYLLYLAENE